MNSDNKCYSDINELNTIIDIDLKNNLVYIIVLLNFKSFLWENNGRL